MISLPDTYPWEVVLMRGQGEEKGTLYLGRIPHGFYEDEMKEYFGQFGEVTRLRLARNRKVR